MTRQNWSDGEIYAIVDDYFNMLRHELAGQPYNKTEHRRILIQSVDRSEGSIERKHMRDARNRKLGKAGEEYVFESEKRRLFDLGRKDLSKHVSWIAQDEGDGYGYDILSFDGTGERANQERWLEIKTTTGPKTTPFFITRNELSISEQRPDNFRLIRLYDFRRQKRAYCLKPPLENHVHLSPTIYRATT